MRADKDFRTYEQALTVVQRLGDEAEAEQRKGKHQEAQYHLSHAIFVGVKHLLFMAADASVDRTEARELAAKNHLAMVELLSLTLSALGNPAVEEDGDTGTVDTPKRATRARSARVGKAIKGAKSRRRSG
jgi:hypothetical protein